LTAPQRLTFRFDQDVRASLTAGDLLLERLGPGGGPVTVPEPTYDIPTHTATFALSGVLPDGNYRATLAASGVRNAAGIPLPADAVLEFFVLAGDANRDRTVGFEDLVVLAQNYGATGRNFGTGDFDYDTDVDFADLVLLAQRYNTSLPPPAASAVGSKSAPGAGVPAAIFDDDIPIRPAARPVRRRAPRGSR
jgi:hypothetical protein